MSLSSDTIMLSAVAARKSRLQQQNALSETATPAARLPSPPQEDPAPKNAGGLQKFRPKRKASASRAQTTTRNKKSKPAHAKDLRYFQTLSKDDDTPDLIIIDDDNESDSDGLSDVSDDDS